MSARLSLLLVVAALITPAASIPEPVKKDLALGGTCGYKTYRIPALLATSKGTLLAFCAARKDFGDWSDIDIAMWRSTDKGDTWSPMRIIAGESKGTVDNPTPIADRNGSVHFLYQTNYERLLYIRSDDDGLTFSKPVDLTPVADEFRREYPWIVIAPGPGHGIQLRNGRLLATLWMSTDHSHRPSVTSTIYSDDHGRTWKRGEILKPAGRNPSENMAIELADGRVMLNIRNESPDHRRAIAYSQDGASAWTEPAFTWLYEPVCMASIIRLAKGRLLFSNPDSHDETAALIPKNEMRPRNNLTIRLSNDDGATWPVARLLEPGRTGYSDLAIGRDQSIYCLYEHGAPAGERLANNNLRIARFTLAWLTARP